MYGVPDSNFRGSLIAAYSFEWSDAYAQHVHNARDHPHGR